MKRFKFLFMSVLVFMLLICNFKNIYAQDDIVAESDEEVDTTDEEQLQEILVLIEECLDELEQRIDDIDNRIENMKNQEEFEYYPAIRLNIDSPILGMSSLVENKLRVKNDISTSDVASGYSLRDIIENKSIRLPDSILGTIVVSTREISIDENMTLAEAKLTLVKCIQYLSQVESASEYVDNKTNSIFKDYISSTKKTTIKDIKSRVEKLESNLVEVSDELIVLSFLNTNVDEYKQTYNTISLQIYEISQEVSNTLISEDSLNELLKKLVSAEADVLTLQDNVLTLYNAKLLDLDYEAFLTNVYSDFEARLDRINKYIENSNEDIEEDSGEDTTQIKTVVYYSTTSLSTITYIENSMTTIEQMLDEYQTEKAQQEEVSSDEAEAEEEATTEENLDTQESDNTQEEELTQEEKEKVQLQENKEKVELIYDEYTALLSKEYKFYINNINLLIDDGNSKITSIISEIDSGIDVDNGIFSYTKYIYVDLPNNLKNYINENNLSSMLEMNNLINLLRNELNTLSQTDIDITQMYKDIVEQMLKS